MKNNTREADIARIEKIIMVAGIVTIIAIAMMIVTAIHSSVYSDIDAKAVYNCQMKGWVDTPNTIHIEHLEAYKASCVLKGEEKIFILEFNNSGDNIALLSMEAGDTVSIEGSELKLADRVKE
mgnify:CR=1 FL=1